MKFYSSETMRQHAQDLTKELEVKQIPASLRYFIINNDKGNTSLPMHDQAYKIAREWASTGLLDMHDLVQEFYVALIMAWNRVDWEIINASNEPKVRLWKYLKKSIILDVRHQINRKKDGIRISQNVLWDRFEKRGKLDDFFSSAVDQYWFWVNDEILNITDEMPTQWETEELHEALQKIMRQTLTDTERLILEMNFGIDEPNEIPRSAKKIGEYFNLKESNIRKIKQRALDKLKTEENIEFLRNFIEN